MRIMVLAMQERTTLTQLTHAPIVERQLILQPASPLHDRDFSFGIVQFSQMDRPHSPRLPMILPWI